MADGRWSSDVVGGFDSGWLLAIGRRLLAVGWTNISERLLYPGPVDSVRSDRLQNPGLGNDIPSSWIPASYSRRLAPARQTLLDTNTTP